MKSFIEGFMEQSKNISLFINSLLLLLVYIFGIGITSLTMKVFGKAFISTKKRKDSYWQELQLSKKPYEEYLKQY